MKKKVTAKFLFASIQTLFAFLAIILALLLRFDLINSQQALNIPGGAVDFYVVMLLIFGFVFIISGLFIIYDWWET